MKIAIASDHAGFDLKQKLISYYSNKLTFKDLGTNDSVTSVDYPNFAFKVAQEVTSKKVDFGILICGTGIGISIAANKYKGIRAALLYNERVAALSKQHNNANIICFGAREFTLEEVIKMIDSYLNTTFEERHQKRIDKINQIEKGEKLC